jgi:hypothetical protein
MSDLENDPRTKWNNVTAVYNGATISHLQYYSAPAPVPLDHLVSVAGDTVFLDRDNDRIQYVLLDGRKRVVEYRGLMDPTMLYPLEQTLVKYTYNNQDELIKREVFDPRYLYLKHEITYTWQNGNIVATTDRNTSLSNHVTTTEFAYHDKEVRSFPFVDFTAFEVVFYQPLFSFGKNCKNPPRKKSLTAMGKTHVYTYDSYVIDDNGYVLSCRLTNASADKATEFSFRYHCY